MPEVSKPDGARASQAPGEAGLLGRVPVLALQLSDGLLSPIPAKVGDSVSVCVFDAFAVFTVREERARHPAGEAGLPRWIFEESAELAAEGDGGADQRVLAMQAPVL